MGPFRGTRVYTPGGMVAHFLEPWTSPNSLGTEAICGRSAYPSLWHGTGTQDEEERARDLRLCAQCDAILQKRSEGELTR